MIPHKEIKTSTSISKLHLPVAAVMETEKKKVAEYVSDTTVACELDKLTLYHEHIHEHEHEHEHKYKYKYEH